MLNVVQRELTLAELEAAASLWTSWLLTLNGTAVTGQEALVLESLLVIGVDLHQAALRHSAE